MGHTHHSEGAPRPGTGLRWPYTEEAVPEEEEQEEKVNLYLESRDFTEEEVQLALEAAAHILMYREAQGNGGYEGWSASDVVIYAGLEEGSLREQQILTAANLIAGPKSDNHRGSYI